MKNGVVVRITRELLVAWLGLPADARVLGIVQEPQDVFEQSFQVIIEHPALPARFEGDTPRVMSAEQIAKAVKDFA